MPTTSTLDVAAAGPVLSPNFNYNIAQQIPARDKPDRSKYAFDAYFAATNVNEPHVQVTNGQASSYGNPGYYTNNSDWLRNELRESVHNLPAVLTTTYNFGSPYRHLLPSVQVNAGGQLYLNNGTLPASGGTSATQVQPAPGNFEVYTCNCATVVQVNNGGAVTVGTASPYTATLRMSANSLLDLRAGGRVDVGAGSVLRIPAGATLVVRNGAALNVAGQVIVEDGAYVCVENAANIVTTGSGTYTASPAANYSANPALGLSGLTCGQPGLPSLQASINTLNYLYYCTSPSGRNNYAQWTAAATGGNGVYSYAWYVDYQNTGNYQPVGSNSTTYGTCLNGYTSYVQVKVVVTSGTQQATAYYYAAPQSRMALYPNPANTYVDVANEDAVAATTPAAAASQFPAVAAASAGAPAPVPMHVMVHNGQAKLVFAAADVTTPTLRLNIQDWPTGLYQVTVRHGKTITHRQLSVQH